MGKHSGKERRLRSSREDKAGKRRKSKEEKEPITSVDTRKRQKEEEKFLRIITL